MYVALINVAYLIICVGGFGSYLTAMDSKTYQQTKSTSDSTFNIKDPMLSWIIPYIFVVGFLGLFAVVPLRKVEFSIHIAFRDICT